MAARELWGTDPFALLGAAAACADAELGPDAREGVGDRTKIAILAATFAWGIRRAEIERSNPSVTEQPFDQALKGMSIARAEATIYIEGPSGVSCQCAPRSEVGAASEYSHGRVRIGCLRGRDRAVPNRTCAF